MASDTCTDGITTITIFRTGVIFWYDILGRTIFQANMASSTIDTLVDDGVQHVSKLFQLSHVIQLGFGPQCIWSFTNAVSMCGMLCLDRSLFN